VGIASTSIRKLALALITVSVWLAPSSRLAAQNHNVHTSWLWHLHQPIYWPDKRAGSDHYENAWDTIQAQNASRPEPNEALNPVFSLSDRVHAYQEQPHNTLAAIGNFTNSGAQVNMSGALMENVQSLGAAGQLGYSGTWYGSNQQARTWTTTGGKPRMDLVNFTYHHAMAPLVSDATLLMELQIHQRQMQIFWGTSPAVSRGYFPTENCFSEHMIPILKQIGIAWAVVANNHLARSCPDMPLALGSGGENCDIPNKADQLNPAQGAGNYQRLTIDRGCAPTAAMPFSYQVHTARYVDPATGTASTLTVVPADQAMGWKDSYSGWDLGLIGPIAARNNTSKPAIVLLAHDGDNAWSGGNSYYNEWVPQFASQANASGYEPTTVEQFLQDWPVDPNDVVHVEDGGWVFADSDFGSPSFINWNWPPSYAGSNGKNVVDPSLGTSTKGDYWRTTIATENRVRTAQQITGITPRIDQVRDPGSFSGTPNNVELAWHYYLGGLDSGFLYYGVADQIKRSGVAQSNVIREIDSTVNNGLAQDTTSPTVFLPQRHPWNPGAQNYGVQYGYQSYTPPNTDFWIWTYAYDASGMGDVTLKYRSNGNSGAPNRDEFKTYAGGTDTAAWQSVSMTRRVVPNQLTPVPQYYADYYYAKITGISDSYVDYYVTATDQKGNVSNTPIQHVYVASNPNGTPTPTPTPTPTATPTATPTPAATPVPFTLDGQADSAGYLEYSNGMTIYAAVRGGILYLATWSPGSSGGANDHFIFVTDQLLPAASAVAPWAKAGLVATAANKPFIGGESLSNYCGWFNAPATSKVAKSPVNGGQLEGTIDLAAAFGSLPNTIYVASAAYSTADGGALVTQGPVGNGDGNIDPPEFMALPLAAIKDENADGKYDRLDPALDFVVSQISRTGGTTALTWNSVPGKTYQAESATQPGGTWNLLGTQMTAGPGQLTLSMSDPSAVPAGFYRVRLVNP
jgi:Glycosyl hydrolase family 57